VRMGINQGTVGVVASTGVALNVGVPDDMATVNDRLAEEGRKPLPGEAGDEEMDADETTGSHSLLCFPIPARFRAFGRRGEEESGSWRGSGSIGVVQLVNKNGGHSPFSEADEAACLGASQVLGHIISNYRTALSGPACRKVFDGAPLRKTAQFVNTPAGGNMPTANSVMQRMQEQVDAHQPSQLIFRCSRQSVRTTRKGDVLSSRCEVAITSRIKDMQREHVLHEAAYKKCVTEKEFEKTQRIDLQAQVQHLQQDVAEARKQQHRRFSLSFGGNDRASLAPRPVDKQRHSRMRTVVDDAVATSSGMRSGHDFSIAEGPTHPTPPGLRRPQTSGMEKRSIVHNLTPGRHVG